MKFSYFFALVFLFSCENDQKSKTQKSEKNDIPIGNETLEGLDIKYELSNTEILTKKDSLSYVLGIKISQQFHVQPDFSDLDRDLIYKGFSDEIAEHWQSSVGLVFRFGGKDTDGDGVGNNADLDSDGNGFGDCPVGVTEVEDGLCLIPSIEKGDLVLEYAAADGITAPTYLLDGQVRIGNGGYIRDTDALNRVLQESARLIINPGVSVKATPPVWNIWI